MPTQLHLPAPPAGAHEINAVVAVVRERGDVAYFASGVPVFHKYNEVQQQPAF